MFALWLNEYSAYYTGKRYKADDMMFPCFSKNIDEAKKYTSDRRARNAAEKLINSTAYFDCEVYQIPNPTTPNS